MTMRPGAGPGLDAATLDALPGLACLADVHGRWTHVSSEWASFAGLAVRELEGNGWQGLLHPEDRARVAGAWEAAVQAAAPFEAELRLRRHDGAYRRLRARARPVADKEGPLVGFCGLFSEAADEPQGTEEQIAAMLESIADGFFAFDREWRFVYINAAAERVLGIHREQLLGRSHWEVYPLTLGTRLEREYRRAAAGEPRDFENFYEPWSRWFHIRCFPRQGGGMVVYFQDITGRKHAQDELRRAYGLIEGITRGTQDMIAAADGELRFLFFNDAYRREFKELWGSELEVGTSMIEALAPWPEEQRKARELWGRALSGESFSITTEFGPSEHGRQVYDLRFNPVHDAHGRRIGAAHILRNVTEQVRMQQALQESRAKLDAALASMTDAVFISDVEGRFVEFNEAFATFHRFADKDECARTLAEYPALLEVFMADGTLAPLEQWVVPRALRGERGTSAQYTLRRKDTGETWVGSYSFSPIRDKGGAIVGAVVVARDITDMKRAEEALREANSRLLEADQRKNEFLAVLSHELRNPLAPIRNSIYILEHAAPGGGQARRARQVIDRQAQHMTRLVEDLLDVTRISRGKVNLQRERVDLSALVRGTAEDHREVYSRSGVELEVEEAGEPLYVDGDATRLAQVIGNLLNNSVKFTPRGGRVVLAVEADAQGEAVVRVRDNGAGMSQGALEHLFEPFVQAAQTLERTRGGLGLGLALVKGLVEMHGGTVTAHSEGEGKGSEFTVRLPLQSPVRPRLTVVPAPERGSGARRVLVIEDNVDAAQSLREVLELGAHEVAIAYTGPEGVEAARRCKPDIILCDIGLPGMDGYGVARALRADPDPQLRSTYLVALSGYSLPEDVARSKEAGFDRHMAKPPSIDSLEALLAEAPVRATGG